MVLYQIRGDLKKYGCGLKSGEITGFYDGSGVGNNKALEKERGMRMLFSSLAAKKDLTTFPKWGTI